MLVQLESGGIGYKIKDSRCGRDRKGAFHCFCGKCEVLNIDVGQYGNDSSDNSGDSRNGRNNGVDEKAIPFCPLF